MYIYIAYVASSFYFCGVWGAGFEGSGLFDGRDNDGSYVK